jgi:hypothetical protein
LRALQASITFIDKILILLLGFVAVFIPAFFIINRVLFDDVGMLWISTPTQEFVYPMDKEQSIKVQGRIGSIEIEVKNRKFRFVYSECSGGQCIKSGWVSFPMMPIVCLPNGVVAVIKKSKSDMQIDGVAM